MTAEEEPSVVMAATFDRPKSWKQELASLVDYNGTLINNLENDDDDDDGHGGGEGSSGAGGGNVKETVGEFAKGVCEMAVELGKSFGEIVKQSLGDEDSFLVKKFGKPLSRVGAKLSFLNEYLPEDRDPLLSWSVILPVFFIAFLAISVSSKTERPTPVVKKVQLHPPSARLVLLPDGRHLAYNEQGVPANVARFSMIMTHSFLSSRLAGIPGLKVSLLEEFGIRLITYDLPGYGESDPHPERTLESSASDIAHLADAVGVSGKFWVLGYSGGSMHVWAALRYIPERLAGASVIAPLVNPYDPGMTKEERAKSWEKWMPKRKLMYVVARRFPRLLRYFFKRTFLSGRHGPIDQWLALALGERDRLLIEDPRFEEFWQRDVEESIRQGNPKPFVEEAALQVSNWGFSIADIQTRERKGAKNFLVWLRSMYYLEEEKLTGFLGPIHIWQGFDDMVVPPSMTNFVHRILPGATVHMLPNDGHFTYLYFCDECHRQIFNTLYGTPQGSLQTTIDSDSDAANEDIEESLEVAPEAERQSEI